MEKKIVWILSYLWFYSGLSVTGYPGVVILGVDHLPAELPFDASKSFGEAFLPYIEAIVRILCLFFFFFFFSLWSRSSFVLIRCKVLSLAFYLCLFFIFIYFLLFWRKLFCSRNRLEVMLLSLGRSRLLHFPRKLLMLAFVLEENWLLILNI